MIEVIKANCGPFIKGLVSSFGDLGAILRKRPDTEVNVEDVDLVALRLAPAGRGLVWWRSWTCKVGPRGGRAQRARMRGLLISIAR